MLGEKGYKKWNTDKFGNTGEFMNRLVVMCHNEGMRSDVAAGGAEQQCLDLLPDDQGQNVIDGAQK